MIGRVVKKGPTVVSGGVAVLIVLAVAVSAWADGRHFSLADERSPAVAAGIDRPDHPVARRFMREHPRTAPLTGEMVEILEAQNRLRSFAGLDGMKWSDELSRASRDLVAVIAERGCSAWSVEMALREEKAASPYWASSVRGVDGSHTPQDISARFVVSEWELGRRDYSAADGMCMREDAACLSYANIMAPTSTRVGCNHRVCANGAQVWVCRYDGGELAELEAQAD